MIEYNHNDPLPISSDLPVAYIGSTFTLIGPKWGRKCCWLIGRDFDLTHSGWRTRTRGKMENFRRGVLGSTYFARVLTCTSTGGAGLSKAGACAHAPPPLLVTWHDLGPMTGCEAAFQSRLFLSARSKLRANVLQVRRRLPGSGAARRGHITGNWQLWIRERYCAARAGQQAPNNAPCH